MSTTDTSDYNALFITTASDHLNAVAKLLQQLPKDGDPGYIASEVFRHIHSLKGSSGVMGYQKISQLCDSIDALIHPDTNTFYIEKERTDEIQNLHTQLQEALDEIKKTP